LRLGGGRLLRRCFGFPSLTRLLLFAHRTSLLPCHVVSSDPIGTVCDQIGADRGCGRPWDGLWLGRLYRVAGWRDRRTLTPILHVTEHFFVVGK
jgi:hypothetical protein